MPNHLNQLLWQSDRHRLVGINVAFNEEPSFLIQRHVDGVLPGETYWETIGKVMAGESVDVYPVKVIAQALMSTSKELITCNDRLREIDIIVTDLQAQYEGGGDEYLSRIIEKFRTVLFEPADNW